MIRKSTIQLLRFHFSLFLLPVFLFALSQAPQISWPRALAIFAILHLLVYPSSNGYNSYMDRDESPIGGLEKPMQPTRQLFLVSVCMDILAITLGILISTGFAIGLLLYILASRAYSYRGIRLKRFPMIGFATVFLFQGAVIFWLTYRYASPHNVQSPPIWSCVIASLLIGALYPLTQIYQHEEDRKDGVTTISLLLGKRGTFIFSAIQFLLATVLMYRLFAAASAVNHFYLFLLMLLPVVLFFLYWMYSVWRSEDKATFRNSLRMNLISTLCTTLFFLTLIILNH